MTKTSAPTPAPDITTRLRTETAAEHEAIEETVGLMAPGTDLDTYRAYLEQTLGFVEPLEDRFVDLLGREPVDWERRRKADRLRRDLRALGLDDDQLARLPRHPTFAASLDRDGAWGAAYVLEGSTLGGQLLERHLREALGPDAGEFLYLSPYGDRQGAMWREFKAALTGLATTETRGRAVDADAVVEGARRTFESMRRWLGERDRDGSP